MTYTFELDPSQVLGVSPDASLEQIREAYRARSKKYHPDLGGDEWAFRMVARSYELLSRARVAGRFATETGSPPGPVRAAATKAAPDPAAEGASVRSGVRDRVDHPLLLVDVELLLLRVEVENPYEVISMPSADRNLSCSLNVSWPSSLADGAEPGPDPQGTYDRVGDAFGVALLETHPSSTWHDEGTTGFRGWMSYPTAQGCYAGFNLLRQALRDRGLGVNQRIREIVIPRNPS